MQKSQFTNSLIDETSPYLLQHAHNPVNWLAWNDRAWAKARSEDKLVLISIGYSSCHWCHVMEHETFEDPVAAKLMNDHFICIKVDREERPDVDHVYMSAVQLMTGQGGWPLNCICLPDGRPIYGGTYFQNAQWKDVLTQLHQFYTANKDKAETYAGELTEGIRKMELVEVNTDEVRFTREELVPVVSNWKKYFDMKEGGPNRAPKFPMPNNYEFLLQYAVSAGDEALLQYVLLTLDKMAFGGIYDQAGGGFARYSTDANWKVPHFEKMLYDNSQLVSLYAQAYKVSKNKLYKDIVYETLEFISREMTAPGEGFYSAIDADSEGEEGKYYVWTKKELQDLLTETDYLIAESYFNINSTGYWEHDNYILLRKDSDENLAKKFSLEENTFAAEISGIKKKLLAARNKRIRPGLDDKQLTSWNALMIKGYCEAYEAFGEEDFLTTARSKMDFLLSSRARNDDGLFHTYKNGKATINGYLEDYAFTIEALVKLYEVTFKEVYLREATVLAAYAIEHFYDDETGMFFFTSDLDPQLIARKKEIHDNVIPSSNSSMAKALFLVAKFFNDKEYMTISKNMLHHVKSDMARYGSSFSNWSIFMMWNVFPFYEIVLSGKEADAFRKNISKEYHPNKILAGSATGTSSLMLLENRFVEDKTLMYVCENYSCRLPVSDIKPGILQLKYS